MDKWVAECLPCKWQTLHDDENAAIGAAEAHVAATHPTVKPVDRAAQYMGHVQNRTVPPPSPVSPSLDTAPPATTGVSGASDSAAASHAGGSDPGAKTSTAGTTEAGATATPAEATATAATPGAPPAEPGNGA